MSNTLSKLANLITILSFPFTTWPVFACLLLATAYLSLDWWKELVLDHSITRRIAKLDAGMEKLQWEILAPKEHLLSSEQCKEARDAVKQ
jgi:hypothetical protein